MTQFVEQKLQTTWFLKERFVESDHDLAWWCYDLYSNPALVVNEVEKKVDKTWIDSKFAEKLISEVLFCNRDLQSGERDQYWP